jgi:hypothetical protein
MATYIRRRELVVTLGSAAVAWPLAAGAQQGERVMRIGVLMAYAESDPEAQAWVAAFQEGLQKLGWAEGRNIRIDTRWATADVESIQRFAKELVALQPELVVSTSTPSTAWLLQQTRTIPIIFTNVSDPVGSGFVASLPRPGGNADRQSARPRRALDSPAARRRGDRMSAPATSWCDPAGESPAQVRGSARLVASVAWPLATVDAKRTQRLHGVWD